MAIQRKHRGFTRLDALVVAAVCLAFVLLVPVLHAMTQERHFRTVCAAHIGEIGKTMFVYANDNETALPRAGGPTTIWGPVFSWMGTVPHMAFGLHADGNGGKATINSSLYLLVKYYQAHPRLFVCPGDKGTTEFTLSKAGLSTNVKLADVWDFGPWAVSSQSCSFAYHQPYGQYALTMTRDPNLAVAADRSPWLASPAAAAAFRASFVPDDAMFSGGTAKTACAGNAIAHARDGQNVLFLNGRVTFETRSYCGVDRDNIYLLSTSTTGGASPIGNVPTMSSAQPANEKDSLLVHDPYGVDFSMPTSRN